MRKPETSIGPSTGLAGWIAHRLLANYWFLALCAVLAAPCAIALSLVADRAGATAWLLDRDLAPVQTSDAAQEVVGIVAGIDAAFITLYFSISLIVLTIAAGNLGVRLIDRWLGRRLVRVSIGGLSFSLVFAVLALAAIDSEADLAETPLVTVALTIALLGVNVAMLAVALHDLGRTMFVDKAIDALATDASVSAFEVVGREAFAGDFAQQIAAPRHGYVEGVDLEYLGGHLADHAGAMRICVAPGQHVLEGEPLALFERELSSPEEVRKSIPIGPFRSDSQGSVFQIRLLVEIAARALSPAVNDFYTALAAADALTQVMLRHGANWVDEGQMPVSSAHPGFELPGQDFRGLFDDPLDAFRQAAADYPSVAIRMIANYGRIVALCDGNSGLVSFLREKARELCEHAVACAEVERDRHDIEAALARVSTS
ncbi:DUF2254 family protein [Alteriqipengyuania lutimaris]|uniref:DUF2254 family protein n=1 Tax=Alteriqipengyuania lutimaris TaxID=1538146 RepID=UPI0015F196D5|nr:DUF2254 family protein [Alteriqipengyuania lutimaris]MBB3032615.1 putative membrane protein [Alteriqipengyuania lutimaris]